jgi:hypothetical protein
MDFQEAESKYFELKGRLAAHKLTAEQFRAEVAELRVQDDEGRYWAVDARTGSWLMYDGTKWVPRQPPGSAAAPPPPPEAIAPRRAGGRRPLLLIGALAVAAVLCLVALGGAGLILARSGGVGGGEGEEVAAVSQQEAEKIADELVADEFPDIVDAEKTLGSYENPAGIEFWTVTYRLDVQAELDGATYELPNVVIVSVDQDTGEAIAARSG